MPSVKSIKIAYPYHSPPPPCYYKEHCGYYYPNGRWSSRTTDSDPLTTDYPPKPDVPTEPPQTPAYPPKTPTGGPTPGSPYHPPSPEPKPGVPVKPTKPGAPAYPPHDHVPPIAPSPYLPPSPSFSPPSDTVVPPPGNNHTTLIAVCLSLGGLSFLAFLEVGLFCLAKKKKKPIMAPAAEACEEPESRPHSDTSVEEAVACMVGSTDNEYEDC